MRLIDLSHEIHDGLVMTRLDELPDSAFRFSAVPPRVRGMGTWPVRTWPARAYAVID
ncbi:MAG: hypothetical protein ABIP53_04080 [Candidatus Limnocylindrales bacterium]